MVDKKIENKYFSIERAYVSKSKFQRDHEVGDKCCWFMRWTGLGSHNIRLNANYIIPLTRRHARCTHRTHHFLFGGLAVWYGKCFGWLTRPFGAQVIVQSCCDCRGTNYILSIFTWKAPATLSNANLKQQSAESFLQHMLYALLQNCWEQKCWCIMVYYKSPL